ncbi:MAG: hypothetical protein K2I01_05405 [Lachnospiraceae bacterium]|nr:hypothetical protein [Lachnospiraceae bacterium]
MRIKILLTKELIFCFLLLALGCGFLYYGLLTLYRESHAVRFEDLNLSGCKKGQFVSGDISSYAIHLLSNNICHGESTTWSPNGVIWYSFYTVPIGDGLYIRIMTADKETLAALASFDYGTGAPVHFEGQVIASPVAFNEEWHSQSETFRNVGQENIVKDFVIRQINIKKKKHTIIAGLLLFIAALLQFFHIGGIKVLFPPDTP